MKRCTCLSRNPFLSISEASGYHLNSSLSHPLNRMFSPRAFLDTDDLNESPCALTPSPRGVGQPYIVTRRRECSGCCFPRNGFGILRLQPRTKAQVQKRGAPLPFPRRGAAAGRRGCCTKGPAGRPGRLGCPLCPTKEPAAAASRGRGTAGIGTGSATAAPFGEA